MAPLEKLMIPQLGKGRLKVLESVYSIAQYF
jgi:hypothetical protein